MKTRVQTDRSKKERISMNPNLLCTVIHAEEYSNLRSSFLFPSEYFYREAVPEESGQPAGPVEAPQRTPRAANLRQLCAPRVHQRRARSEAFLSGG